MSTAAVADPSEPTAFGEGWSPSRRLSLKQARMRSRLTHSLRFLFVGLAAASIASVFVYTTAYSIAGGFRTATPEPASEQVTMVQPRFTGRLSDTLTYQITADRATREGGLDGPIALQNPVYAEETGRVVLAPNGFYDSLAGRIELSDGVTFTTQDGDRFTSHSAVVDVESGVLRGETEIVGEGPLGVVRADAYELHQSDGRFIFRGRVRGVIPE